MNQRKRKKRWLLLALLLLLLGGTVGWSAWPDRRLAQAKQLQQELLDPASRNLPAEERREKWRTLRETTKQLSPAQRQKLQAESRKRRQAEMARYFQMSAEDKARYLDEQIARMEQRRQARQGAGRRPGARPGPWRPAGRRPRRDRRAAHGQLAQRAPPGQARFDHAGGTG